MKTIQECLTFIWFEQVDFQAKMKHVFELGHELPDLPSYEPCC